MSIFDKVNDASRGLSEKTKSISELGNLKRKILYEDERITEIYQEIGRLYFKDYESNVEQILAYCDDIETRERRIKNMKREFYNIRGYKLCLNCHSQVGMKFSYCGTCGAKVDDPTNAEEFESNLPE